MAKKQNNNAKNANNASIQRSKAYANQVKKMFDDCVDDILAVQKTIPTLTEGQMFSFDACPMNVQKKVEELLRRLSSTVTLATQAGIKLEWDKANASADSLLASVAGKAVLRDPHFSAYTQRNHEAMYNFMNRKEGIMKLSDRIWQTTKQLREEMEVALTVGIGEGKSAKEMAKDVKQYLNEPDLMFRRFRYKKGEKITDILDENGNKIGENKEIIWGKKWKKLEIDANGKKHFIDYDKDSYKTGAGYYKSAHKNAMRVTRTETNMAYKRSDQQRWQQFDFILGYHVEPCANHEPEDCEPDICEFLQGDYPKDFIFEGWHPCCKCVCTPIMMDEDEMLEMFDAQAQGKEYTPKGRQITDYPDNFKQWCQINADKIEESHKKGKDPYFIRHNWKTAKAIADDKWEAPEPEAKIEAPVKKTPFEIAEERHANRTEAEKTAIMEAYNSKIKYSHKADEYINEFAGIEDTTALQEAKKTADWDAVKAETLKLAQKKRSIIENAIGIKNQLSGISDVNISDITDALKEGSLKELQYEIGKLEAIKDEINSLQNIVEPMKYAKLHSLQAIKGVDNAVGDKLAKIATEPLEMQEKMLYKEIKYVADADYLKPHKIYSTWEVAQNAYLKKLAEVQDAIWWKDAEVKYKAIATFKNKSSVFKNKLNELNDAIANKNKIQAETIYNELEAKKAEIENKRDKKNKPQTIIQFGDECFTQERMDKATWHTDKYVALDDYFDNAVDTWKKAQHEEKVACVSYTEGSGYITKYLRGIDGYYEQDMAYAEKARQHINSMTSYIGRSTFKKDVWVKRDEIADLTSYKFGINVKQICDNEMQYAKLKAKRDTAEVFKSVETDEKSKATFDKIIKECDKELKKITLRASDLVGKVGVDESFMSCATSEDCFFAGTGGDNKNGRPRVCLRLFCPQGTQMTYADAFNYYTTHGRSSTSHVWDGKTKNSAGECEIFVQRGTKMKVIKAEYKSNEDILYVDVQVIGQNVREFETEFVSGQGYKAKFK